MSMIQRYDPEPTKDYLGYRLEGNCIRDPKGDYVLFSDHERLMAEKDAEIVSRVASADVEHTRILDALRKERAKLRQIAAEYRKRCKVQGVKCVGYPRCDGDLVGMVHEPGCPRFGGVEDDRCEICKAYDELEAK